MTINRPENSILQDWEHGNNITVDRMNKIHDNIDKLWEEVIDLNTCKIIEQNDKLYIAKADGEIVSDGFQFVIESEDLTGISMELRTGSNNDIIDLKYDGVTLYSLSVHNHNNKVVIDDITQADIDDWRDTDNKISSLRNEVLTEIDNVNDTLDNKINTTKANLENSITTIRNSVTDLDTKVTTVNSTLQNNINNVNTTLNNKIDSNNTILQSNINNLSNTVETNRLVAENNVSALNNKVVENKNTLQANIQAVNEDLNSKITTINTNMNTVNTNMNTLANDIIKNKGTLQTISESLVAIGSKLENIGLKEVLWSGAMYQKDNVITLSKAMSDYDIILVEYVIEEKESYFEIINFDTTDTTSIKTFVLNSDVATINPILYEIKLKKSSEISISILYNYKVSMPLTNLADVSKVEDDSSICLTKVIGIKI